MVNFEHIFANGIDKEGTIKVHSKILKDFLINWICNREGVKSINSLASDSLCSLFISPSLCLLFLNLSFLILPHYPCSTFYFSSPPYLWISFAYHSQLAQAPCRCASTFPFPAFFLKKKDSPQTGRKYLQMMKLTRA